MVTVELKEGPKYGHMAFDVFLLVSISQVKVAYIVNIRTGTMGLRGRQQPGRKAMGVPGATISRQDGG
jgi:hypothetical protein